MAFLQRSIVYTDYPRVRVQILSYFTLRHFTFLLHLHDRRFLRTHKKKKKKIIAFGSRDVLNRSSRYAQTSLFITYKINYIIRGNLMARCVLYTWDKEYYYYDATGFDKSPTPISADTIILATVQWRFYLISSSRLQRFRWLCRLLLCQFICFRFFTVAVPTRTDLSYRTRQTSLHIYIYI